MFQYISYFKMFLQCLPLTSNLKGSNCTKVQVNQLYPREKDISKGSSNPKVRVIRVRAQRDVLYVKKHDLYNE